MKFLYEFRTSDNVQHSGAISAPNREAAFSVLKERGIRPFRLVDAPGFFNLLLGRGKRWIAISVLAIGCVSSMIAWRRASEAAAQIPGDDVFVSRLRHQIIGDAAVIEKNMREAWASVFAERGDRFLASYAIPGSRVSKVDATPQDVMDALGRTVGVDPADGIEIRQVKLIVQGMKDELRAFLCDEGRVEDYMVKLAERQEVEKNYYDLVVSELSASKRAGVPEGELEEIWERQNGKLRKMGIKLVPMPE